MKLARFKNRNLFGLDMIVPDFLRREDICSIIKDEVIPLIKLAEFEGMYKEGGRPPISPVILIVVTLLQYLESLTDRAAAFNLRYRLDWKIALGLELDYKGIHFSLLSVFRNRLLENDKASLMFDKILEHLVSKGLVQANGKQRIDSTHIVGCVRELSRLELLSETLRTMCNASKLFVEYMPTELNQYFVLYSEKISSYHMPKDQRDEEIKKMGLAMKTFIGCINSLEALKSLTLVEEFKVLKIVYDQNFIVAEEASDPELIKISTGKDHISSPHEPEARYANKGGQNWIGYKAQIAETVTEKEDEETTNFITFAELTESTEHDGNIVAEYIANQEFINAMPSEVYGDTHYNCEKNIVDLLDRGIDLKGPVMPLPLVERTLEKNRDFKVDHQQEKVFCPIGNESIRFSYKSQGHVSATFDNAHCIRCLRKEICSPEPRGKNILIRGESEILAARRSQMVTAEFKEDMHHRNGIEGTLSGLVRGQEIRQARYRGLAKTRLQIKFSAAAANLKRLQKHQIKQKVY